MCVPPCCGSEVVANTEGKGAKEDGADAVRIKVRGWRRRCEQKGGRCQYSALHCWSKLACYKSPESEQAMQIERFERCGYAIVFRTARFACCIGGLACKAAIWVVASLATVARLRG